MNLANKITCFRFLLIPIFVVLFYFGSMGIVISSFIFIIAALTDFFDGCIARKRNEITILGSFLDPVADKILTMAAFILLVTIRLIPAWSVISILAREFIVNGLRFVAAEKNIIISASFLGKIKTMLQMIAIVFLLFSLLLPFNAIIFLIGIIIYWIAVVVTVISGVEYIYRSRELLKTK